MLTATRLIIFALLCCALCATAPQVINGAAGSEKMGAVERVVHVNPPGANESRYFYIPFEVPAHATRISVTYQYDRANGANTIDIGLFDARSTGTDTDPRGFRGWSGGRRSELSISRDEATPGYLPGALPAGTWRVILGLYKIAPAGVDVTLKINVETEAGGSTAGIATPRKSEPAPAGGSAKASGSGVTASQGTSVPQTVAARGARWLSGDLHMHTVHSDGNWTIAELIESARGGGLDFIVVTDHNTSSHHAEVDRLRPATGQPLVLRGEEITTYGGHTNAWGLPSGAWVDFRVRAGDAGRMARIPGEVHRLGALISINHPFALCGGCSWSYDPAARGFDGIEVWNGTWDATDERAVAMWDEILRDGRHITAIASSDSHRQDTPTGQPSTHVAAGELSQSAVLEAIRRGRVYLTGAAAQPAVSFEAETSSGKRRTRASIGDELGLSAPGAVRLLVAVKDAPPDSTVSLVSNGGVIRTFAAGAGSEPQAVEVECARDSYFRLEVRDKAQAMIALTNPIYVKVRAGR